VRLGRLPTVEEQVAQLPFTFKAVAPFRIANFANGTAMLASFEGRDPSGDKPMIIIGRASTRATPREAPQEAEKLVRQMSGFGNAEIEEQNEVTFAGGDGRYIAAAAGGRTIIQYLRVLPNGNYLRLVARGRTAAMTDANAAIKEIADSVALP
jgi:hypothetical protein